MKPIIKIFGGKRKLIDEIFPHIPKTFGTYFEPFMGGCALGFYLERENAVYGDLNSELINFYTRVRDDLDLVVSECDRHMRNDCKDYFYRIRGLDRIENYLTHCHPSLRAGRWLYINKTCHSGNCRVNRNNQINIPYANELGRSIYKLEQLQAVSDHLNLPGVQLLNQDFIEITESAKSGDLIYFDPPYFKLSKSSSFNGYNGKPFKLEDHQRLKQQMDRLCDRGCKVILSNSWCDEMLNLFTDDRYEITFVMASRSGNSETTKRGKIKEMLAWSK